MSDTEKLFQSILTGDVSQVQTLLDQDPALADAVNPNGVPALLFSLYVGQPAIAPVILHHGAIVDIFSAAALDDTQHLSNIIANHPALVNTVAPDGFSPLGLAAFFGSLASATLLIEHGARVNQASQNPLNVMPLHSAVAGQHLEIARLLVEHGADVNARQADDFTPLQGAAQNGQLEMIQLLLDHGADPSAHAVQGQTALDLAQGHPAAAALILAALPK